MNILHDQHISNSSGSENTKLNIDTFLLFLLSNAHVTEQSPSLLEITVLNRINNVLRLDTRTFEYATNNLTNITLRTFVISHIANSSTIHQKLKLLQWFFAAPSVFSVNSTYGISSIPKLLFLPSPPYHVLYSVKVMS